MVPILKLLHFAIEIGLSDNASAIGAQKLLKLEIPIHDVLQW
jgi:hypothetical protein